MGREVVAPGGQQQAVDGVAGAAGLLAVEVASSWRIWAMVAWSRNWAWR